MISNRILFEEINSNISIKKLNLEESKKFINKFKDASPKYLNNHDIYAAIDGNKYIGGIVINLKPAQPKFGPNAEVSLPFIYIMPKYRGQRLSNKLLQIPINKYNSITLTTGQWSNEESRYIIKKVGFKIVGGKGIIKYWYWEK